MDFENKNKKRRVLIFSLAYFPKFVGGAEVAIKEIADRLPSYEFDMVTLRFDGDLPREEKIGNVNVYRVGYGGRDVTPQNIPVVVRIMKIIAPIIFYIKAKRLHAHEQRNYEMVWAMMANQAGIAASIFKKKNPDVPFLLTLQEGDSVEDIKKKVRFFKSVFKKIFVRADYVQAISVFLKNFAESMGYVGDSCVVPNGVDTSVFNVTKNSDRKEGDFVVVTASRLVKKNGVADLIRSLEFLPSDIKLIIIGNGPLEEQLKSLCAEIGVSNRVSFEGFLSQQEINEHFNNADVFCRPSLSEGMGNVFLEAMAAGLPVIATNVGGIPDIVSHGEDGLLVDAENPRAVAESIMLLREDSSLRQKLIENGLEKVATKYTWDNIARQMDEVLSSVKV